MLDKSIPYAGILMKRAAGPPPADIPLPPGYTFVHYRKGDEAAWAKIETSVLEFDSEFAALLYFRKKYGDYTAELSARCVFIADEAGELVATATAWWEMFGSERRSWLHWVAVRPEHQHRGLGRAIVSYVTRLLLTLDGERELYLHTQTWSHRAIRIYRLCGFCFTDEPILYTGKHDNYNKAVKILRRVYAGKL